MTTSSKLLEALRPFAAVADAMALIWNNPQRLPDDSVANIRHRVGDFRLAQKIVSETDAYFQKVRKAEKPKDLSRKMSLFEIEEVFHSPGSGQDILGWLHHLQDRLSEDNCFDACGKNHESQGCPSGSCSLNSAKMKLGKTIDAFETEQFGMTSKEYWEAANEPSKS